MKLTSGVLIAALLCAAGGCGGSSGSGPAPTSPTAPVTPGGSTNPAACVPGGATVCLEPANLFNPDHVTIKAGSSITFNNTSGTTHNVTFTTAGAPDNVADFASGTQAVAFPTAGTYDYHCTIHGTSMSGEVVVQ